MIVTAKSKALEAAQLRIQAEEEGKRDAEKAKWKQEEIKAVEVTKAQQAYEVAQLQAKEAAEKAKKIIEDHREVMDEIAEFLIEKETITGKEFMEIFHEVEGIDPDAPKKEEARIGMNPVEGEGFVMKPADDIDDAHNADVQEKSEKTEEKTVGTATESVHEE